MRQEKMIGGRNCYIYGGEAVGKDCDFDILIQAVDEHESELLDAETALIREGAGDKPFLLAAFLISDWNEELSPWEAPPVFGKEGFGAGAERTLQFILGELLPELLGMKPDEITRERISAEGKRICLGGYSLAGLFALWAASRTEVFRGIAAVSPSVWFPGWEQYSKERAILVERVYLSLGDKEEKTRNPVMAKVGDAIRQQYAALKEQTACKECVLEWNPGNHFVDAEKRTAKGFVWLLK